jgi:hypothetical protein
VHVEVISISITGDYGDRLEVVGDGVDPACHVSWLRKKFGRAEILQVDVVKDNKPEEKKPGEKKKPEEEKKPEEKKSEGKKPQVVAYPLPQGYPGCYHCPPVPQMVIYDEPAAGCVIM